MLVWQRTRSVIYLKNGLYFASVIGQKKKKKTGVPEKNGALKRNTNMDFDF